MPQGMLANVRRLAGWAWLSVSLVLAALAIGVLEWAFPSPPSDPSVQWLSHRFSWLHPTLKTPEAPNQIVQLPDAWKPRGLPMAGQARYVSVFSLSQGVRLDPESPWALRIERICGEHRVRLNGQLLFTTFPEQRSPGKMESRLIDVPAYMLRPGPNELAIDVSCQIQGGLSAMTLAPKIQLTSHFEFKRQLAVSLPLALNVASLAFAFFLLTLWWLRRDDASIGLLGLLTIVGSLRNCTYYISFDPVWSTSLTSWLHFNAHLLVTVLMGWFTLAFTRIEIGWYRRLLNAVAVSFPVVATVALPWDPELAVVRSTLQGAMVLIALPGIWLLFRFVGVMRMKSMLAFALGMAVVLMTSVHDFVLIRLLGDPLQSYWVPIGFPLALPGLYMVMAERLAEAITQVEQINLTLEERVAERTADLAAANAAKSDFLAAASHDLRQPMVAIALTTGLLKERLREPDLSALVSRLSDAVGSMEGMLSRLLDLSRLEAGAVEVRPQRVALQPLVQQILASELESARLKGLQIRAHLSPHAVAWADPVLLEQILRNLIGNAVRYTERGGVLVATRRRGTRWLVQVWDTGVGIAPADQQRIFQDFVQLSSARRHQHSGLGLGLALVRRAAAVINANVSVHSRVGRGSCFDVSLPMAGAPRGELHAELATAHDRLPELPLDGCKVLLLEDDRSVRMALERRLGAWGAVVVPLSSLADLDDALTRVHDPDLLLTDYSLDDGNGLEAMDIAQRAWPRLRTVIITGDTAPSRLQALAGCGAPVLHKPFNIDELARTLMRQHRASTPSGGPVRP